jgi:CheY-like chemotaxis protein
MAAIEQESPDVVMSDIRMPPFDDWDGIRAAAELSRTRPEVGVVMLSQYAEPALALQLFEPRSQRLSAQGTRRGPRAARQRDLPQARSARLREHQPPGDRRPDVSRGPQIHRTLILPRARAQITRIRLLPVAVRAVSRRPLLSSLAWAKRTSRSWPVCASAIRFSTRLRAEPTAVSPPYDARTRSTPSECRLRRR